MTAKEESQMPQTEFPENVEDIGRIEISDNVIAMIASQAATKVEGVTVVDSSFRWSEFLGKDTAHRGVSVKSNVESGRVEINVDAHVDYGVNIYDAAHQLQFIIKEEVEALTGTMIVDKVNVRIRHLNLRGEEERDVVSPNMAVDDSMKRKALPDKPQDSEED